MAFFFKMPPDVVERQKARDVMMLLVKLRQNREMLQGAALGALLGG